MLEQALMEEKKKMVMQKLKEDGSTEANCFAQMGN